MTKVGLIKAMVFSSSHVWIWEVGLKEGWALKNWCFRTMVLEKTLESPLDSKEIKPINSKWNQPWIFIGRTEVLKLKLQYSGHLMQRADSLEKTPLFGKDPHARKDWKQENGSTGWDGWMASLTQWTWVWANSGRWWRTGKPGMLQSMGSQRVRHDWATELKTSMWDPKSLVVFTTS